MDPTIRPKSAREIPCGNLNIAIEHGHVWLIYLREVGKSHIKLLVDEIVFCIFQSHVISLRHLRKKKKRCQRASKKCFVFSSMVLFHGKLLDITQKLVYPPKWTSHPDLMLIIRRLGYVMIVPFISLLTSGKLI